MSDYPKPKLGSKEHIAGTAVSLGAAAYFINKKPKPKGLKAPTAKTAEKVTNRALQRHHSSHGFVMSKEVQHPKRVAARTFKAFQRKYPQALDARLKKEQAHIKNINKTMGKNLLAKITKSVTPAGVVATVMSPTTLGDATLDGKKYTNYKYTPNK
jgi:hypothetical protein